MDTLFEFVYYLGFVACLSSLNNNGTNTTNQTGDISFVVGDSTTHVIDTTKNDSLKKAPLFLGAQQAKRLSECDTIVIYQ